MLHSVAVGFQPVTFGCGIMQTQLVKIMPGWLKPKKHQLLHTFKIIVLWHAPCSVAFKAFN